jgi:hypothetical protein
MLAMKGVLEQPTTAQGSSYQSVPAPVVQICWRTSIVIGPVWRQSPLIASVPPALNRLGLDPRPKGWLISEGVTTLILGRYR